MNGVFQDIRDTDASTASFLSTIWPSGGPERNRLIFSCEGAFNSDCFVSVLHDDWILLYNHMVHISTTILEIQGIILISFDKLCPTSLTGPNSAWVAKW